MNEVDRKREVRRQRALERLGANNPHCIICGESDWQCLERHHVAGICHDEQTIIVCRNCHRKLSDTQKDHAKPIGSQSDALERIAHFLRGIADFFELLVKRLREFAATLIAHAVAERTGDAQS